MGKIGNGRKINKKSPGVSCTGGEGWVVEQEARRGNPGVRRWESEGSGIAGGTSWVAGDWSTGAGEDHTEGKERFCLGCWMWWALVGQSRLEAGVAD